MKLTEFRELCQREWGEARSDIVGLRLTDESYAELASDVLTAAEPIGWPMTLSAEPACEVVNPVTRSVVKVARGADADSAEVRRHYGKPLEVRQLPAASQ